MLEPIVNPRKLKTTSGKIATPWLIQPSELVKTSTFKKEFYHDIFQENKLGAKRKI